MHTAEFIRLLRDLDMPLAGISALLNDQQGAELQQHLREHLRKMEARRDEVERVIARLERALEGATG